MDPTLEPSIFDFVPLLTVGVLFAIPAYMLALEKGRNPWKWVILALIPLVNVPCIYYFLATPSTRLEDKIDALLKAQGQV